MSPVFAAAAVYGGKPEIRENGWCERLLDGAHLGENDLIFLLICEIPPPTPTMSSCPVSQNAAGPDGQAKFCRQPWPVLTSGVNHDP